MRVSGGSSRLEPAAEATPSAHDAQARSHCKETEMHDPPARAEIPWNDILDMMKGEATLDEVAEDAMSTWTK